MSIGRRRVAGTSTFEDLVNALIETELPGLPADRRIATVGFCGRRLQHMAGPARIGLQAALMGLCLPIRFVGPRHTIGWLRATRLPVVADIARLIRYLVVSFVWERWPSTAPDGSPGDDSPQPDVYATSCVHDPQGIR